MPEQAKDDVSRGGEAAGRPHGRKVPAADDKVKADPTPPGQP